ncbi:hypothetical protein RN001_009459 [Aquatica leii]|uniref:Uncharacterized protein n=1 Tax=Aquatica leii TaxID=1421715 RepID=A0AAN7P6P4_9COLE|nr:hypothetical protein RN001_009459 [Aquatica leii]
MIRRKNTVCKRQFNRRVLAKLNTVVNEIHNKPRQNKTTCHELNDEYNVETCSRSTQNVNMIPFNDVINNSGNEINFAYLNKQTNNSESDNDLRSALAVWASTKHVSQSVVTDILRLLHPYHPELPLNCRTLLKTPTNFVEKEMETGTYCHIGLKIDILNLVLT